MKPLDATKAKKYIDKVYAILGTTQDIISREFEAMMIISSALDIFDQIYETNSEGMPANPLSEQIHHLGKEMTRWLNHG